MAHCFTIGYQGRSLEDLCSVLFNYGVDQLIDIRERAWSNRPEFRKQALEQGLATVGIEYEHFKEAGNPFRPRNGQNKSFEACAREYRRYLRENSDVLDEAEEFLLGSSVAFFCYEANSKECHRSVLVEELSRRMSELAVDHL